MFNAIFIQLFFNFVLSVSERAFIETKHMEGGVFGWPNALLAQRNLWASIPLPVKFYKTNINVSSIVETFINETLENFSINDIINDALDFGSNDDKNDESSKILKQNAIIKYNQINFIQNLFHKRKSYIKLDDEDDDWYKKCGPNYPNVDKLGSFVPFFKELGCEKTDEIIGQFLCYGFVIVPIVVMWVLITLFYIFYCCGCCCCCRAKDRYGPGVVSIVFFALIALCLVIALVFNILASIYMLNILNYVLPGDMFKDIDYSLSCIEPSLKSAAGDIQGNITKTLIDTSTLINDNVDDIMATVIDLIKGTVQNFTLLNELFQNVSNMKKNSLDPALSKRDEFPTCHLKTNDQDPCSFAVDLISPQLSNVPIESVEEIISSISSIQDVITNINSTIDNIDSIQETKDKITSQIDKVTDEVKKLDLPGQVDDLDLGSLSSKLEEYEDGIPLEQFHPAFKAAVFLFPFFLLILTALEIMAFWLKNCCSRCIVCYCLPRCICTFCLFLFGIMCTLSSVFLLIINLVCDQGDDAADVLIKKLFNENRTLVFREIEISEMADGMISNLKIDDITIEKPKFIDNFINAKLNTKLTDFIPIFDMIPIERIGNTINNSFTTLKFNVSIITDMVNKSVSEGLDLSDFDLVTDLPAVEVEDISKLKDNPDIQDNLTTHCALTECPRQFNDTIDSFSTLLVDLNDIIASGPNVMDDVKDSIDSMPSTISLNVENLVQSLLFSVGSSVSTVFNVFEPTFDSFDANWVINLFNIIRVKGCRNLLGAAMAFSISAHLFIIGFAAMTILLCVRRKGMGKVAKERSQLSYSYSYSEYSYSKNEPKGKKKKGKENSDDENTSGNGLIELQNDDQPHSDIENRDVDDSKIESDDQSNYQNPYQHEDSTSFYQNNESNNQQSESFHPRVSDDESQSRQAKVSEYDDDDDDESSNHPNNNNNIKFHDDGSSGNNSDIEDGDQQTYIF